MRLCDPLCSAESQSLRRDRLEEVMRRVDKVGERSQGITYIVQTAALDTDVCECGV